MFENKYSKLLTVLLIIGIIVIIAVFIFLTIMTIRNNQITIDQEEAVDRFQSSVNGNDEEEQDENVTGEVAPTIGIDDPTTNNPNDNEMTYKGFKMVGTIEIPSTDLKCPVLAETTKASIEVAVAVYDGPGLNQVGNTTIVGHNYRNGTFFSNNKLIANGDKVYITDLSGKKITYTVYDTIITSPEDSSYLDRDTQGKREITLVTCTDDTKSRIVIYAVEE